MRHLPPLAALRAFEAAARHLNFRRAADELGVTPTAISHQVRLLEASCGAPLFRRRPRPLALTEAGQRLFPVLCRSFDQMAAALAELPAAAAARPLRVTTPGAFAGRWLVPRLPRWRRDQPDRPLDVIGTDAVLDLHADQADIAIRYGGKVPGDLVATELFRDRYFPICTPALMLELGPVARAADLMRLPQIHFDWSKADPDRPDWDRWLDLARRREPDVPGPLGSAGLSFRQEMHAIDAVLAGQGVALLSDISVARDLAAGTLVRAHELSLPGRAFHLVHLPGHPRRALIDTFAAWLVAEARASN